MTCVISAGRPVAYRMLCGTGRKNTNTRVTQEQKCDMRERERKKHGLRGDDGWGNGGGGARDFGEMRDGGLVVAEVQGRCGRGGGGDNTTWTVEGTNKTRKTTPADRWLVLLYDAQGTRRRAKTPEKQEEGKRAKSLKNLTVPDRPSRLRHRGRGRGDGCGYRRRGRHRGGGGGGRRVHPVSVGTLRRRRLPLIARDVRPGPLGHDVALFLRAAGPYIPYAAKAHAMSCRGSGHVLGIGGVGREGSLGAPSGRCDKMRLPAFSAARAEQPSS